MAPGSRADGALANSVRSGRKQPQRVHVPGRSGSHLSRPTVIPAKAGISLLHLRASERQGDSSLRWNDGEGGVSFRWNDVERLPRLGPWPPNPPSPTAFSPANIG